MSSNTLAFSNMCDISKTSTTEVVCPLHVGSHAHTQTEILSIFPSTQQKTSVGNESAAARKSQTREISCQCKKQKTRADH